MAIIRYLAFWALFFAFSHASAQNDFAKTTLITPRKGIKPTFVGTENGKAWFYYFESIRPKSIKMVSVDNSLQINTALDYKSMHMGVPGNFSYTLLNDKLYAFYTTLKFPKYCLANLELETFDFKTNAVSTVPSTSFKNADAVGCDLIGIQTISSPQKKRTALIQLGSLNKILLWVYDENFQQVLHKEVKLKGTAEEFDPDFLNWNFGENTGCKITDEGDIYFCYRYYNKRNANCTIARITANGEISFAEVPLEEGEYNINFTIDDMYNSVVSFTKSLKNDLMDSYGVIMFDKDLKITGKCSLRITDEVENEVKQYGTHHEGVVYLAPKNVFKRSDGSLVIITEQSGVHSHINGGDAPAQLINDAIVVFFLNDQLKQTGAFTINKRQISGAGYSFNSFASYQKGDNVYLFYNSNFVNENLPKLDFMMRMITPDNKVSEAMVLKNKDKDEKAMQNVIPKCYRIADDEIIFVTTSSNSYGTGNTEEFSFFDVKFLK